MEDVVRKLKPIIPGNCRISGLGTEKLRPLFEKNDSIKSLLEGLDKHSLRNYLTCNDNSLVLVTVVVVLFVIAVLYNNKIASKPNRYISKIDSWPVVFAVSFVACNFVLGENMLLSFVVAAIMTYGYHKYIDSNYDTKIPIDHMDNVALKNDSMTCVCTCSDNSSQNVSVVPTVEQLERPVQAEGNGEERPQLQLVSQEDLKVADKIINQGEQLIVQAEDTRAQAVKLDVQGASDVAASLAVKSEEMRKEGEKMILTGEKIKVVSAEANAKVMIDEGKKQVSKGKQDIVQGRELVRIGEGNIGKQLIDQGKVIKDNGKALIETGKQIKKEIGHKLREIEHVGNILVKDNLPTRSNLDTDDVLPQSEETVMVSANGSMMLLPPVSEDNMLLPLTEEQPSMRLPLAEYNDGPHRESAGVPTINDVIDSEIAMSPSLLPNSVSSSSVMPTPQVSEEKKEKMVAKGQNDVLKGEILASKGKKLLKLGDYINGNKLMQKGQHLQNSGKELIQCASLIDRVGKRYSVDNVLSSGIQHLKGLVSGYDADDFFASF